MPVKHEELVSIIDYQSDYRCYDLQSVPSTVRPDALREVPRGVTQRVKLVGRSTIEPIFVLVGSVNCDLLLLLYSVNFIYTSYKCV